MINEVHVEFLCRDHIFESVKKWVVDNPNARLMFLVDSCPHCNRLLIPCDILERYSELAETNPIGLHTHLFYPRHWWVDSLTYDQQYNMLLNGIKYLHPIDDDITHFAPGNWRFNKDTIDACHKLGLTNFHWHEHEDSHETVEYAKENYDMNFISSKGRYTHDWTIHYGNKVLVRV